MDPYPLIWADAVVRSLVKLACLPRAVINGAVRVTHVRIDENPVKGGHTISALTRRAKETASQNMLRWKSKNDSSKGLGHSVMTHCRIRQQF